MPKSPPSACTEPGCAALVPAGEGSKCDTHRKAASREYRTSPLRKQLEAFYNSKLWRAVSKDQRMRNPLCAMCYQRGVYTPAQVTDHIVEVQDNWALRLEPTNLQSLCIACNTKKGATAKQARNLPPAYRG